MKSNSILLVENDPICQFLTTQVISKLDDSILIKQCENGFQALEHLNREQRLENLAPRFILLDWHMPVMNGKEFMEVRRESPFLLQIPVYVMSSSQSRSDFQEAILLGAVDFLPKPFTAFVFEKIMEHITARV